MRVRRTPFLRVSLARIRRSSVSARAVGLREAAATLRRLERAEPRITVAADSRCATRRGWSCKLPHGGSLRWFAHRVGGYAMMISHEPYDSRSKKAAGAGGP